MSEPYDPQTAISKIREILLNDGYLKVRDHCYLRMGERTIDDLDIKLVLLENGVIYSKPEFDKSIKNINIMLMVMTRKGRKSGLSSIL
jgi:hypothetical protein